MSSPVVERPIVTAESLLGFSLPPCPPDGQPADVLRDVAVRMTLGREAWDQIAPYLVFDPRQYRRVRLWRDADWEALLLCWLPGHHTAIHDHGGSQGVAYNIMGTLHEVRYDWDGPGSDLRHVACTDVTVGGYGLELSRTIHEVANETAFPAASLHLYSPPLTTLGAYDLVGGNRREVDVTDSPEVQVGGDPRLTS